MRIRLWLTFVLLTLSLSAVSLSAQSGAPSQPSDKTVGATDFSREAVIIDRLATRASWQADGTGSRQTTAVIRVQADSGVQELAVLAFTYTSANETVDVDYVRVRKPDGTVVVTPEYNVQDMPSEVTRVAPMYSDIREKHVAVKALNKGDILEYSVRYNIVKPQVAGQFWFDHSFQKNLIVRGEDLVLDVPAQQYVNISSPESQPKVTKEGERKIYSWHVENLKREERSDKHPAKRDSPSPSVQLTTFRTWDDVGSWYRNLQSSQVTVTASIRSKAAELTKGLTTDDQKLRALYNFVATRFHYVSLSFGTGRYQPHRADDVLDNEYGDCKDKHTLLAALLKAAGYEAWPALINSTRKITVDLPSPGQFDHMITVVPRDNTLVWLDTTPDIAPYGLLLANLRDKQALVIPIDKASSLMKTPDVPPFPSLQTFSLTGKLGSDGVLKGHVERSFRGDMEVLLRYGFRATAPAQWNELAQRLSYASGFAGDVSAITASAPDDTEKPFQFSYDYNRKDYGDWSNRKITPPLPPFGIEASDDDAKPSEPLILGAPGTLNYEAQINMPAGYTFTPPSNVDLVTDYADYHAQYAVEKGVLTASRHLIIKKAEVPLAEWDGYLKFRKAVSDDENFWIGLTAVDAEGKPVVAGIESNDANTLNESGRTALNAFNYKLAADLFEKAVKIDPSNKWAWNNLGLAYTGLLRYKEAVSAFNRQVEINPNDQYAYNNLGRVLRLLGKNDEARAAFEKQIQISPQDQWAHANLGSLLVAQKKYDAAVPELETAVKISAADVSTHIALGQAYLGLGQTEKGIAALDQAVQITPSPFWFNNVAFILAENGERLDKARQFAEAAVSSLDGLLRDVHLKDLQMQQLYFVNLLGASWDTLGWVYYKQGHLEQAERYLSAAWSLDQHSAVADHLGQLFEKKGDKKTAAKFYADAIAAVTSSPETHKRLLALLGSDKEADALVKAERDAISRERTTTVQFTRNPSKHATAEFFLAFLPDGKVDETKFVSGDEQLTNAASALATAKYNVVFPGNEATKLVRRGILNCFDASNSCEFVLLLPVDVRSLN